MKKANLIAAVTFGMSLISSSIALAAPQVLTAELGAYPGSSLAPPQGSLSVTFDKTQLNVQYQLQGLAASSSGGLHIHTGTSCAVAADVGGHYWDAAIGDDTWKGAKWRSNGRGESQGGVVLTTGYSYRQNIGHAVVIHNSDGTRIACGVLQPVSN